MKKCVLRITILSLIFCIFLSMKCVVSNAAVQIWDSSAKKYRSYTIYNQSTISDTYIKNHGCGTCCLTTLLHAYGKRQSLGPKQVHKKLEKKIFGNSFDKSHPLGLNGIKKVLLKNNISAVYYAGTYGKSYIKSKLKSHLSKGKPAVVLLKGNSKYNCAKKISGFHYILLLKYNANTKKVVVGDSSGKYTRTHYESLDSIVTCMVKGKSGSSYPYYFNKTKTNGGMLLITE